jgi:hypothetical protein
MKYRITFLLSSVGYIMVPWLRLHVEPALLERLHWNMSQKRASAFFKSIKRSGSTANGSNVGNPWLRSRAYVDVLQVQSADARPVNEKEQAVTDANAPQALKEFREHVWSISLVLLPRLHCISRSREAPRWLLVQALWSVWYWQSLHSNLMSFLAVCCLGSH